jgi:hypothetical protein
MNINKPPTAIDAAKASILYEDSRRQQNDKTNQPKKIEREKKSAMRPDSYNSHT